MVLVVGIFLKVLTFFIVLQFSKNEALYFYSEKAHGRKTSKKSRSSWGKSFFLHPIENDPYEGLPEICPEGLRVFMMRET